MDFNRTSKTIVIPEKFIDYYSGMCPFCGCKNYKIIDTWKHSVSELGGPKRKIMVDIESKRIKCLNSKCGIEFTPEHPNYPKGFEFSLDVIEQSLNKAHQFNISAEQIAFDLEINNSVTVHPKTIQSWINLYSEEYFTAYFKRDPEQAKKAFKSITIDGTYFTAGKKIIGKKKDVQLSSVIRLPDGSFLLTWWE